MRLGELVHAPAPLACRFPARFLRKLALAQNLRFEFVEALVAKRRHLHDGHLPHFLALRHGLEIAHVLQLGDGAIRSRRIGLVDHDDVRRFHDSGLHRLQFVAITGHQRQDYRIGDLGYLNLALPDADGLDQNHVLAHRVHDVHCVVSHSAQSADGATGGHRADEHLGVG